MKIFHVFNNNIVATLTDNQKEAVVQGSGIGFKKKPGDLIDESKIEKLFIFFDEEYLRFEKMMEHIPIEHFQLAQNIFERAQIELKEEFGNQTILALTDHIGFAVERYKKQMFLPNLLVDEIRTLYKKEFDVGLWGLELINKEWGVELPIDEAGYITMHLINCQSNGDSDVTTNILMLSKGVVSIIKKYFNIDDSRESLNYIRLMTHLRFLAQRIFMDEKVELVGSDELYEMLMNKAKRVRPCICEVVGYIKETYGYVLPEEEQLYLLIHLAKIINQNN